MKLSNSLSRNVLFLSVQFSRSVVSNSLRPHEPQHTRPPCPSPTPGVHPNPCPLSRWCHPAISSSVVQCVVIITSFATELVKCSTTLMFSQILFCRSVCSAMSDSFVTPWTVARQVLLVVQETLRRLLKTTVQKHQFFRTQLSLYFNSHVHTWLLEKNIALTRWTLLAKENLCFSICCLGWS